MIDEQWDQFVIYVNAYYAVQEAYDSARRYGEVPARGLKEFCRDANPFLWDGKNSAEESVYEGFKQAFVQRFAEDSCTPEGGYDFARDWLGGLEGAEYGTALVASFDEITNRQEFRRACSPIARQLAARASHEERTPQDVPELLPEPVPKAPSAADIEAVIALLANGDESFANSLRERLENNGA